MKKLIKRYSKKAGLPPGTVTPIGPHVSEKTTISYLDYTPEKCQEKTVDSVEECLELKKSDSVSWININGLGNVEVIEKLGEHFGLHPLTMEDIANTGQRPKYEDLDGLIFLILKMLTYDEEKQEIFVEQVSLILGDTFVLSFQELAGDVFDPLRKRIRDDKGRIRKQGADYLAYAICDAVIDNYFYILEKFSDEIEIIEDTVVSNPTPETLKTIYGLKQDTVLLRKSIWPLREVISGFERSESKLIKKSTRQYLRDVYDHTVQIIETVEAFRDLVSGLLDIYLSSISNRMNEVMKVLTIIATIFIPLTFVAGIYGMNFKYMPELEWRWAYFAVLGFMGIVFIGMLAYFRRKKWL